MYACQGLSMLDTVAKNLKNKSKGHNFHNIHKILLLWVYVFENLITK